MIQNRGGELIQNRIFLEGNYFENRELYQIVKYIPRGSQVVDVGANIGNHTVFFLLECDVEHVYAFEPTPSTVSLLRANLELNNLTDRCTVYDCALGARNTKCSISVDSRDAGSNRTIEDSDGNINMSQLDSVVVSDIDFIKIDVEGFEYDVLLGGEKLIRKSKPVIYIEIFPDNFDKVDELLTTWGYSKKKHFSKDYIYQYACK